MELDSVKNRKAPFHAGQSIDHNCHFTLSLYSIPDSGTGSLKG